MPGRIPVTIIDKGKIENGEKYFTVACETEYFYQQQDHPTDGFNWWCTTIDCPPAALMKKLKGASNNDKGRN